MSVLLCVYGRTDVANKMTKKTEIFISNFRYCIYCWVLVKPLYAIYFTVCCWFSSHQQNVWLSFNVMMMYTACGWGRNVHVITSWKTLQSRFLSNIWIRMAKTRINTICCWVRTMHVINERFANMCAVVVDLWKTEGNCKMLIFHWIYESFRLENIDILGKSVLELVSLYSINLFNFFFSVKTINMGN